MKPASFMDRHSSHSRAHEGPVAAENRPLSPPDTEISSQLDPYATPPRRPSLAHPDPAYALPTIPATPDIVRESAGARFRRLAGIPTTQSGSREFRGASRPQTRWLIVLMPPSHLTNELAVGHRSPGRIANGLLIPLFPTLFAQLTAIAKEFSLPSTTGLCLYLHLADVPATPRITDETWPLLWSRHLHTDDSALPLGLPVAGRVEFDIDIPNARWYPMWFAHVSRQELVPDLARAIPPSPRGLGRDLSPNSATRVPKSVPRPLALVPRDEPVVQVDSVPSPAPSPSRTSITKAASKETVEKVRRWSALVTPDPALRADHLPAEPKATDDTVAPPTDETPAPLSTEETPEDEPLNLEDFQWSITSAGPPSPTSSCATSASSRVVSIHLLERNEGSVLLTPTTATTWGPPSVSDVDSDFNLNLGWRVRSPDIGERAEGSVLLTPSTATSWGAPLSYPPTPAQWAAMQELVRSPDLGERAEGSVLLTPSTATTWGAPLSYPPTPAQWYAMQQYVRSPDAGQRAEGSVLLTPSTATTWGAPETYPPTPEAWAEAQRGWVASPDLGARVEVEGEFGRGRYSTMAWGTEVETEQEAYARMGLPWISEQGELEVVAEEAEQDIFDQDDQEVEDAAPVVLVTRLDEPEMETEPFDLARFELAADDTTLEIEGNSALDEGQSAEFYAFGSDRGLEVETDAFEYEQPLFEPVPIDEEEEVMDVAVSDAFEYELPHFELVEGEEEEEGDDEREYAGPDTVTPDTFEYPLDFELHTSDIRAHHTTYLDSPSSMITTRSIAVAMVTVTSTTTTTVTQTHSYGAYPFIVLYPAVYPHLELYPVASAAAAPRSRPVLDLVTQTIRDQTTESVVSAASPQITDPVEPALVEPSPAPIERIPNHAVYAQSPVEFGASPVESIKSVSSQTASSVPSPGGRKPSLSVLVPRARSSTIVAVNPDDNRSRAWSRTLPPVPPMPREVLAQKGSSESARSITSSAVPRRLQIGRKPSIVLDNTEFELLPSEKKPALSTAYPYQYPDNLTQLYPPVRALGYPYNLEVLYPVVKAQESVPVASASAIATKPASKEPGVLLATRPIVQRKGYPVFDLYPAVYPYNLLELYPPVSVSALPPLRSISTNHGNPVVKKQAGSAVSHVPANKLGDVEVRLSPGYPTFDLFPAVYPYNLERIYPASIVAFGVTNTGSSNVSQTQPSAPKIVQQRGYPVFSLYPAVYPYNLSELYPSAFVSASPPTQSAPRSNVNPTVKRQADLVVSHLPVKRLGDVQVRLSPWYPAFDLFPAIYPYSLERIYPACVKVFGTTTGSSNDVVQTQPSAPKIVQQRAYPVFDLYPAVYPHNLLELYPSAFVSAPSPSRSAPRSNVNPTAKKPEAVLYVLTKRLGDAQVRLSPRYPAFDLFPAVYPYNLERIYPTSVNAFDVKTAGSSENAVQTQSSTPKIVHAAIHLARTYPNIELYAPVYPFNLDIYPPALAKHGVAVSANPMDAASAKSNIDKEMIKPTSRTRKTHAQLYAEARRKTHTQLVAEVFKEAAQPVRVRKSHDKLQAEVFPNGLPEPASVTATSPQVTITPVLIATPESEPTPQPATKPLRRQRSGTVMMRGPPVPAESIPPVPPLPQTADLGRSRSMLEARTQMFERTGTPTRSQTISAPRLVRGKNASFERAMSLFHEETGKAGSEGSKTPPRTSKNISKLDMSKFKFS